LRAGRVGRFSDLGEVAHRRPRHDPMRWYQYDLAVIRQRITIGAACERARRGDDVAAPSVKKVRRTVRATIRVGGEQRGTV
jgi:hypothetical protein